MESFSQNNNEKKIKVFIGSSSEAFLFAKAIHDVLLSDNCSPDNSCEIADCKQCADIKRIEPVLWNKYFNNHSNKTFIDVLKKATYDCSYAIFVLNPDDDLITRSQTTKTTRANVWFEAGLFMGHYSNENVFFFLHKDDFNGVHLISDIQGLNLGPYNIDKNVLKVLREISKTEKLEFDSNKESFKPFYNLLMKEIKNSFKENEYFYSNIYRLFKENEFELKDAKVIIGADACFERGKEMVKNANNSLMTTIGFTNSLEDGKDSEKYKEMFEELKNILSKRKDEEEFYFKRLFNTSDIEITNQKKELQKYIDTLTDKKFTTILDHTDCEFLEIIISDNRLLMVFPDLKNNQNNFVVGWGIYFEKPALIPQIKAWFQKQLTKEITKCKSE
jgi:predicted nucleotide-binding protein